MGKCLFMRKGEVHTAPFGLPAGYTKLVYIQSSGTEYIDTGVYATEKTKIVADCEVTYASGYQKVLGAYNGSVGYFSWWTNGTSLEAYYGLTYKSLGTGPTGRMTLIADRNTWSANTTSVEFSETTFTTTSTIYIFSILNGGDYANAPMKLYSCQIYDDGTIVRDYVPCINPDGEIGLYDRVDKQFYGNAGTGTFVGSEVS